jgi:quercetin dioxygenase-like cupin family protein
MHLAPGGLVGEHEAMTAQLFCIVAGDGWVSGDDGQRQAIKSFEAALWTTGERHAAGTVRGMTAIVIEGEFTVEARPMGRAAAP